jgi:hypothetical protein
VDQAQVALLDEVQQRHAGGLVRLGDGDHQAQVGGDEALVGLVTLAHGAPERPLAGGGQLFGQGRELGGGVAACFDAAGELCLIGLGQQRVAADLVQVDPDQVFRHLFS